MNSKVLSTMLFLVVFTSTAWSQNNFNELIVGSVIEVELTDGNKIRGQLLEKRDSSMKIESLSLGNPEVSFSDIKSLNILSDPKTGKRKYYFDNPVPNRNFILETAYGLPKGQFQYQNVLLGINTFSYGLSDNFTLSGGFETFSLFTGGSFPIVYVSPKYSTQLAQGINMGVGGTYF